MMMAVRGQSHAKSSGIDARSPNRLRNVVVQTLPRPVQAPVLLPAPTKITSAIPDSGKAPRFTGLDPDPDSDDVHLHWNTNFHTPTQLKEIQRVLERLPFRAPEHIDDGSRMVPGTAIAADLSKQRPATIPVTHYYDIDKACRDCGLRFIFFAEEQKYWYEELGFPLESDAVRCQVCRRREQHISRTRKRYMELSRVAARSTHEDLDMANCCLDLIEERVFSARQLAHVRELLNRVPEAWRASIRV